MTNLVEVRLPFPQIPTNHLIALKAASPAASIFAYTGAALGVGFSSEGNRGGDRDRAGLTGEAACPAAPLAVDAVAALGVGLNGSRSEANGNESNEDSSGLHDWCLKNRDDDQACSDESGYILT